MMTEDTKAPEENTGEVAPEAKPEAKAAAKPKKPAKVTRKSLQASRVSHADRHTLRVKDRDSNFKYRWVNHDDGKNAGRVEKMLQRGYTFANKGDESLVDSRGIETGTLGSTIGKPAGNGIRAVLMKIPNKYYEEDLASKQAEVDRTEEGMVSEDLRSGASDIVGDGLKVSKPSFSVGQN